MRKHLLRSLLVLPVLLVLAVLLAWYSLLHTTAGAVWLLETVQKQLPGKLSFVEPEGTLSSGLTLTSLQYVEDAAAVSAERLQVVLAPRLLPFGLVIESLGLDGLTLWMASQADESKADLPEELVLPFPVEIVGLDINGLDYLAENREPQFRLESLSASASVHESLELHRLEMARGGLGADISGRVGLLHPFPVDLIFNSSGTLDLASDAGQLVIELNGGLGGNFLGYSLRSAGDAQHLAYGAYHFSLDATGDFNGADIGSLEIESDAIKLGGSARLEWQDDREAELVLRTIQLDPSAWLTDWPESIPLFGGAVVRLADDLIGISSLEIGNPDAGILLGGSGSFDLSKEIVSADIAWKGLSWPLNTERPDISSPAGRLELGGSLDDWSAKAEIEIEARDLPPGTLLAEGAGNPDGADIEIIDGRVLGGEFAGLAEVDWSGNGAWSAQLSAKGIEAAAMTSGLLGSLNTVIEGRGQAEPFGLELDILELDSSYGGAPFQANGRLRMDQSRLEFEELLVRAEDSTLELNGDAMSEPGLRFSASISNLGIVSADLEGAMLADGRLSLAETDPWLELEMRGDNLAFEGTPLFDRFSLLVTRERAGQAATFDAGVNGLTLIASLVGDFTGDAKPLPQRRWRGQLKTLELKDEGQPYLSLMTPADVGFSSEQLALGPACLGAVEDTRACVELAWTPGGLFSASAALEQASLDLAELLLETGLEFSQVARGEIRWQTDFEQPASGFASIRFSPGEIRFRDSSETLLTTGEGSIGFRLQDGRISSGNFDLPLPGQGEVDLDFSVENLASGLESNLDGRLVINLADIDPLADVLPLLDRAGGRFTVDLQLSGTTGNPFFTGHMGLSDGLFVNEAIGFKLDDIQLAGQVVGNDETRLQGSFSAVEGTGRLLADLDLSQILEPRLEINVEGENLTLFDAPDLKLVASPDIRLEWRDDIIGIHGKVLVPSARIAPRVVPQAAVSQSPDLVIVAGEISGSRAEEEEAATVAIRGNLEVELGEDVQLDLAVARANIGGSVTFSWQDDLLPIANGSYQMKGEIIAYGQLLQITRGNIGFPGVPADNPQLNIRAERRIYGNSEVRRAGLFVTGTLRRPIMEPYTDPMTNRERAQTLLITGSDFNMETGVGAVDIGTYIAPRVWVSYGIGVFEDENVVSIRYDLGRNWGIKATSGQRQTGLDMSYTIDQ